MEEVSMPDYEGLFSQLDKHILKAIEKNYPPKCPDCGYGPYERGEPLTREKKDNLLDLLLNWYLLTRR